MTGSRCYGCMKWKNAGTVCEHCGWDESAGNAAHQLPAGTVLKEQYLVGRALGQGGFGITYLGWDLYLDIPVAIKEYFPNGTVMRDCATTLDVSNCTGDDGTRFRNNKERFLREAKMLARFSQVPQIVQVKNFFLTNNTAYIVMEYVEGINLKDYVKQQGGKLSVAETFAILEPVIQALCKVHKAGLVHRDISPDNIMMQPGGGAKLLDFGAVRDVGAAVPGQDMTKSTEAILKQGYAPIEQYQKRGSLGPWTDVYALCATIFFCLTGNVPPDAPERLLMDDDLHLQEQIPQLTEAQRRALERGMELRVENRIPSMDDLYQELFRSGEPLAEASKRSEEPQREPLPVPEQPRDVTPAPRTAKQPAAPPPEHRKPASKSDRHRKPDPKPDRPRQPDPKPDRPRQPDPVVPNPQPKTETEGIGRRLVGIVLLAALSIFLVFLLETLKDRDNNTVSVISHSVSGVCGTDIRWKLDRNTGELVLEGSGDMPEYIFAEDARSQTGAAPWYEYREEIKTVTVKAGVTAVGGCAFAGCTDLESATLAEGITVIGENAFAGSGLSQITLPRSLQYVQAHAFAGTNLTEITMPEGLNGLGTGAFAGCDSLEQVTFLGRTVRMTLSGDGELLFSDASGKVSENLILCAGSNTLPEEYARIHGYRFRVTEEKPWDAQGQCGSSAYWYLDLDSGLLRIDGSGRIWSSATAHLLEERPNDRYAPWVQYRDQIRTVSIGDGISHIGDSVFSCCAVEDVHFGSGVISIGMYAFMQTRMQTLVFPDQVTNIERTAFWHCEQLVYVQLPENLRQLNEGTFAQCTNLQSVYIGRDTYVAGGRWTPFSQYAMEDLPPNLTVYSLPGTSAEAMAKKHNIPFARGYRGMAAEKWGKCGDDVFWFKSGDTLMLYGSGNTWRYRVSGEMREKLMAEGWKEQWLSAGDPSFYGYRREIRHIIILPGVDRLYSLLFCDMPNLETVDFGTVRESHSTFHNCGIQEVVVPEHMTHVGDYMFHDCTSLRVLTIHGGSRLVGEGVVAGCTNLEEIRFSGRECILKDTDLLDPNGTGTYSTKVVFHVRPGSAAHRYAQEHGIEFVIIE